MAASDKIVETICPSCNFHCHFSVEFIGKKVTCEKCQTQFEAVKFNPASLLHNFYKIALKNDLINEDTFERIFSEHKAAKKPGQTLSIEDIFVEKGLISIEQKNRLMLASVRKLNKKFTQLATEKRFITKEEAETALEQQAIDFRNNKLTLVGDILIDRGQLNQEQRESLLKGLQKEKIKKVSDTDQKVDGKKQTSTFVGVVAVKKEIISREQFEKALSIQRKEEKKGIYKPFEDILFETGIISSEIKDKLVLKTLKKLDKKLGAIAIENGFVTKEELKQAAAKQAAMFHNYEYTPLFQILLEEEDISEIEYDKVMSEFQGLGKKQAEELAEKGRQILTHIALSRRHGKQGTSTASEKNEENNSQPVSTDEPEISIGISEDYLSAYVTLSSTVSNDIGASINEWVKDIKDLIEENEIVFGVIKDELIEACLNSAMLKNRSFKVAIGEPAEEGKKAEIIYHFETNYLKAGVVTDDGVIDFRDRGDIPYTQKGTLLAELIPAVQGKNGYDILGNVIEVAEFVEVELKSGAGTVLSEDGLKLYADIDGRPDLAISGEVSVFSEMTIQGDVNFETGNIDFKGNINVQGNICEGFKVKGVNVTAKNINGGDVDVTGNIDVSGGIVDSKIKADGYVQAMYISDATLELFGDLLIVKEILDSDIRLSGMCKSERCKIISSSLSAKMGVEVGQIGTDVSEPCKIRVGINDHIDAIIRSKKDILIELKGKLDKKQKSVEKYIDELRDEHQKIIEESMLQDTLAGKIQKLKNKVESDKAAGNTPNVAVIKNEIDGFLRQLKRSDTKIEECFNHQDRFLDIILSGMASIESNIQKIEILNEEISGLTSKSQSTEGKSIVKVKKQLFAKTMIFGKYSSIVTQEDLKNVIISEVRITDPEGRVPPRWEMQVKKTK